METITSVLALLSGLFLRLVVPVAGTLTLIYFLRKLDAHWQAEAAAMPVLTEKVECWKTRGCTEDQRAHCAAGAAALPCWQVFRRPNGYLQEKCISCEVFVNAPVPVLKTEPRRM